MNSFDPALLDRDISDFVQRNTESKIIQRPPPPSITRTTTILSQQGGLPAFRQVAAIPPPQSVAAAGNRYGFRCTDASDEFGPKIVILDGDINGELPDGMGADNYTLSVSTDGWIWAVISYDTTTFEITSRSLDFGADVPVNTFGTLYATVAFFAVIDPGGGGQLFTIPTNRHCGDINVSIRRVILNGTQYVEGFSTFGEPAATGE